MTAAALRGVVSACLCGAAGLLALACSDSLPVQAPADSLAGEVAVADAGQPDQAQAAWTQPCGLPGWTTVTLDISGQQVETCAPDYPVWGRRPLSPTTLTDLGQGMVADSQTGLVWQRDAAAQPLAWAEASGHCDALTLGSQADWRLPTVAELHSLVDFARHDPALPEVLGATKVGPSWTLVTRQAQAWTVDFSLGAVQLQAQSLPAMARCVRRAPWQLQLPTSRFAQQPTGGVLDRATHLTWLQFDTGAVKPLFPLLGWCAHLDAGGYGWRMPTAPELAGLVDRSATPAIANVLFPGTDGLYWTMTMAPPSSPGAWAVDFGSGGLAVHYLTALARVRCVRDPCGDAFCAPDENATLCPADCPETVAIAAGGLWMGCDGDADPTCDPLSSPRHWTTVSAFAMDRHEVTVAQYEACALAKVCTPAGQWVEKGTAPAGRDMPVNYVTWQQARQYCTQFRGKGFDLPTEAQWELAARGPCPAKDGPCPTARSFPWGEHAPDCDRARYAAGVAGHLSAAACTDKTTCGCGHVLPDAVAARPLGATPQGIEDLAGNVAEWTRDAWQPYAAGDRSDPGAPDAVGPVAVRGGSFLSGEAELRVTARQSAARSEPSAHVGFRCVHNP